MTVKNEYQVIRTAEGLRFVGVCLFCGSNFQAKRRSKKYCSLTCKELFGRKKRQGIELQKELQGNHKTDVEAKIETLSTAIKEAYNKNDLIKMEMLQRQKEHFLKQATV
jgi:hypothetical protein